MAKFVPLHKDYMAGSAQVLYVDAAARPTDLWETADYRQEAAYSLANALAASSGKFDERAVPAVANAIAMLLSDARAISSALYAFVHEREAAEEEALALAARAEEAEALPRAEGRSARAKGSGAKRPRKAA
jgi:hypothetical protein